MVTFLRSGTGEAQIHPGHWRPLRDGDEWSASIRCPKCGQLGTLLDHDISSDGVITPSLVCPNKECDFHESGVALEGWPPT